MTTLKRWFAEQKFTNAFRCCRLRLECRQGRVWVKENIRREQQSAQREEEGKPGDGHRAGGYLLQAERREVIHRPLSSLTQCTMVLTSLGSRIWVQALLCQVHT